MIPQTGGETAATFRVAELPTRTFALDVERGVVSGMADGLEAMKQAIYLILNTERFHYLILSWNYGVELSDLIGKSVYLVIPELEGRITAALTQDTRIKSVDQFTFARTRESVQVSFVAHTIYGDVAAERTVKY